MKPRFGSRVSDMTFCDMILCEIDHDCMASGQLWACCSGHFMIEFLGLVKCHKMYVNVVFEIRCLY